MSWELFTRRGWKSGKKAPVIMSLTVSTSHLTRIFFGKHSPTLLEAGQKYEILFDRDTCTLGIRRSANGYKLSNLSKGLTISIRQGFAHAFGLSGKFQASEYRIEDDIIAFPLKQVAEHLELSEV